MSLKLPTFAAVSLLALASTVVTTPASALTKQECIQASERGQQFRDEGKLAEARTQLLVCVQEACPRVVADACREDLANVEKRIPSVVLSAKTAAGQDLIDVQVQVDGVVVSQKLDGRAVPMNPGPHKVRMEADGQVMEEQVVVIEGEKSRAVRLTMPAKPGQTPPPPGNDEGETTISPAAWIFGGLAVASLGTFAYFGITGRNDVSEMRNTCGTDQTCDPSRVDAAKQKLLIGDIFLGVGILSGIGATYFFLTPKKSSTPVSVGVSGPSLLLRGQFN